MQAIREGIVDFTDFHGIYWFCKILMISVSTAGKSKNSTGFIRVFGMPRMAKSYIFHGFHWFCNILAILSAHHWKTQGIHRFYKGILHAKMMWMPTFPWFSLKSWLLWFSAHWKVAGIVAFIKGFASHQRRNRRFHWFSWNLLIL